MRTRDPLPPLRTAALAGFLLAACAAAAAAQDVMTTDTSAARIAFERIRSLEGVWSFHTPADSGRVTYEVVSNGSAVLERVVTGEHGAAGMVSVIHLEGGRLVLQHYCSAANQPRLVATHFDSDEIVFELDRLGNGTTVDGHIAGAVFAFPAGRTFESRWTWRHGADTTSTRRHSR